MCFFILKVCELGLNASSGNRHVIVPIAVKHSLLITWVKVKQLLSQQVTKTLGSDDEVCYVLDMFEFDGDIQLNMYLEHCFNSAEIPRYSEHSQQ